MLSELFAKYIVDSEKLREEYSDLSNIDFHIQNELKIKVPGEWDVENCLFKAVKEKQDSSILVFYSDTQSYKKLYSLCKDQDYEFHSFFELYFAIMNSAQDVRHQERIKECVSSTSVVIVFDSRRCPELALNAIRQYTTGVLILIN